MYTKGFWIILASYEQIGSKVVWGKCAGGSASNLVATFQGRYPTLLDEVVIQFLIYPQTLIEFSFELN